MQSAILEKTEDHLRSQDRASECFEFVKKRNAPDALVIDPHGNILWVSHEDSSILRLLEASEENIEEHEAHLRLIQTLKYLRISIFSQMTPSELISRQEASNAFFSFREQAVSLRGQVLKGLAGTPNFIMILVEPLKRKLHPSTQKQHTPHFTPREQAVLHYLKKGLTNKEIASVLDIGVHTVKDHLKRIMKKTNVHTRTGIFGKLEEKLVVRA